MNPNESNTCSLGMRILCRKADRMKRHAILHFDNLSSGDESVDELLCQHFLNDILVVTIPQRSAQFTVIHIMLILPQTPQSRHLFSRHQFELTVIVGPRDYIYITRTDTTMNNSSYHQMVNDRKRIQMEAEMNRFEQEISSRPTAYTGPHVPSAGHTHFTGNTMSAPPTTNVQFIPHAIQRQQPLRTGQNHHQMHQQMQTSYDNSSTNAGNIMAISGQTSAATPGTALGTAGGSSGAPVAKRSKTSAADKGKKPKKMLRMAGGTVWEDNTLAEWDSDDFRIFCGDLGNDVTDDVLSRAFNRFPSFVKAKVIRDKRSNKSRGYGFVSFKDPQDFTRAIKDMNVGKYF
ncbi:unnamed protein product [Medioppia subpectinata]|uniref:RNA-binding protein 42 n=1 Tax=Medioppia subpectinata TaxID=1979941 RepID=A0A7R9KPD8_9ACAR|nr:unnamed protein product [Medioppia subpectinata]CAG2107364.1 unnamed protein product [Medioppia subpectinata]